MPGSDQVIVYKGEDVDLEFTMNPVVDITGWTINFNVLGADGRPVAARAAVLTDAANGVFTVSLLDDDLDALRAGTYRYDAWRTDPGLERAVAVGDFVVRSPARDVT